MRGARGRTAGALVVIESSHKRKQTTDENETSNEHDSTKQHPKRAASRSPPLDRSSARTPLTSRSPNIRPQRMSVAGGKKAIDVDPTDPRRVAGRAYFSAGSLPTSPACTTPASSTVTKSKGSSQPAASASEETPAEPPEDMVLVFVSKRIKQLQEWSKRISSQKAMLHKDKKQLEHMLHNCSAEDLERVGMDKESILRGIGRVEEKILERYQEQMRMRQACEDLVNGIEMDL